jgi:protocatechuate 3,4-dioxygenase beta subunit
MRRRVNRRRAPALLGAMCTLLLLAACAPAQFPSQPPTPALPSLTVQIPPIEASPAAVRSGEETDDFTTACVPPAESSPAMTEGPYFKAGSPERASLLEASTPGETLVLSGYVLSTTCEPIAGVKMDFWQTDGNGTYDNTGYGLRGHQFTDPAGRYELTTVIPGIYPGRTAHIHVKVEQLSGKTLTTQLFFPGQANDVDRIFDERLLVALQPATAGWIGRFDFVLAEE